MIKIKNIEFIKSAYDDSLSHKIFSIANVYFSNYPPILGALLYWKKNHSKNSFTKEDEYKFFYDSKNKSYFASVKFPKDVALTKEQKQELAYILLKERGYIGTYTIKSHPDRRKRFNPKRTLEKLHIPDDFDVKSIPYTIGPIIDETNLNKITKEYPYLTEKFITDYCYWRYCLVKLHPSEFEPYLKYVDFSYVCYSCDQLTEKYLIDHLDDVDISALQYNYPILARLSSSFKKYMIDELIRNNEEINPHFEDDIDNFINDCEYFYDYSTIHLLDQFYVDLDEDEEMDYQFFEYDRGPYIWPGSEHMVKGIPSLASQLFDDFGFKKPSNKEMDLQFKSYTPKQISLISAILEPHWLHRYRDHIDWKSVCSYNEYLTDKFLESHMQYVDFNALGNNLTCFLSQDFIEKHLNKFNLSQPVPLVIRHLTEKMYINNKDKIKVNSDLLCKYYDSIGGPEYTRLLDLLENE